MLEPQFGADDLYWSSLPTHLRNFIRNALPLAANTALSNSQSRILPGGVRGAGGQMAMYTMAQNIVSAASRSSTTDPDMVEAVSSRRVSVTSPVGLPINQSIERKTKASLDNVSRERDRQPELHRGSETRIDSSSRFLNDETEFPSRKIQSSSPSSPQPVDYLRPTDASPLEVSPQTKKSDNQAQFQTGSAPSTRAAGKQPMTTSNHATTNPSAQAPPTSRSARSAGKAPVQSHPHQPVHSHTAATGPAVKQATGVLPAKAKLGVTTATPARNWRITTVEERICVRNFWTSVDERSRKHMVKMETEGVLRKLKDQLRHSCTCSICGRKRLAIEEELEQLYEAYAHELDAFAQRELQFNKFDEEVRTSTWSGPFPGSVDIDPSGNVINADYLAPDYRYSKAGVDNDTLESDEEYDDEDEEYDEDEEDDVEEDDLGDDNQGDALLDNSPDASDGVSRQTHDGRLSRDDPVPRSVGFHSGASRPRDEDQPPADFLRFSGELSTIKGVLSVADDLMRSEGQRFLEMMEQLAERRAAAGDDTTHDMLHRDETEPDEFNVLSDDRMLRVDDGTGTRRLDEGRRVFHVFAARLLEHRILQAYREQLAQQKQLQFLKELEEEQTAADAREARKAKEAQKKKDKRKQQRQAKEDDRLRKELAAAAEAEAVQAKQRDMARLASERREAERQRKENERKAKADELIKREEERRNREAAERERDAVKRRNQEKSLGSQTTFLNPSAVIAEPTQADEPALAKISAVYDKPISQKSMTDQGKSTLPFSAPRSDKSAPLEPKKPGGLNDPSVAPRISQSASNPDILKADTQTPGRSDGTNEKSTFISQATPADLNKTAKLPEMYRSISSEQSSYRQSPIIPPRSSESAFASQVSSQLLPAEHRISRPVLPMPATRDLPSSASNLAIPAGSPSHPLTSALHSIPLDYQRQLPHPQPIGPIQPIGRPKGSAAADRNSGEVVEPDVRWNSVPERVLGSAALSSVDDEVILPTRRPSHLNNLLGHTWNSGAISAPQKWNAPFPAVPSSNNDIWCRPPVSANPSNNWSPTMGTPAFR